MIAHIRYTGRLEVAFPAKPDARLRTALKERGFAWDPLAGVWHLARPVSVRITTRVEVIDGFAYALDLLRTHCGLTAEGAAALTRQHDDHAHQLGAAGMEAALGIA